MIKELIRELQRIVERAYLEGYNDGQLEIPPNAKEAYEAGFRACEQMEQTCEGCNTQSFAGHGTCYDCSRYYSDLYNTGEDEARGN